MDDEDEKWVKRQRMAYHNGETQRVGGGVGGCVCGCGCEYVCEYMCGWVGVRVGGWVGVRACVCRIS